MNKKKTKSWRKSVISQCVCTRLLCHLASTTEWDRRCPAAHACTQRLRPELNRSRKYYAHILLACMHREPTQQRRTAACLTRLINEHVVRLVGSLAKHQMYQQHASSIAFSLPSRAPPIYIHVHTASHIYHPVL
jgi:hypothetical protein